MQSTSTEFNSLQNKYFRDFVPHCVTQCCAHYGTRLIAIYVWGSVHRGEAIQGVSDLDLMILTTDAPTEKDEKWRAEVNGELGEDLPASPWGLFPPANSAERFLGGLDSADAVQRLNARDHCYLLRYDATLVYGQDPTTGLQVTPPDKEWAQFCFQDSYNLIRHAAGLESHPESPFELPDDHSLRLRKLARTAVIVGAYLLAAQGAFRSFKGVDVLPLLQQKWPQWAALVEETSQLHLQPIPATAERVSTYLHQLVAWMDWTHEQLKS